MKVCSVCERCYEDAVLACSEVGHGGLTQMRAGNCEIIPNYRLEFLHESSAAGDVYRAENTILRKTYLIRIIAPELFGEAEKKQFLRETQGLAAIIHPNVARVYESGTLADGALYVVTEYLTAQTLRECLVNVGAPSEVTALTITRQAAEGLEAIHAANALHRSINPENIVLTADAENHFLVKLQNPDFGGIHQKAVNARAELNRHSLKYFSPEQCAAQAADAQTDVYSMGIVLYEILAGRVPFDAGEADIIINKQINEPPPPVKINNFDIRMLLTHTLTDALQKTARTRLKTANALTRRIRHIEQLATHSSTPPPVMSYPAKMDKAAVVFTPQPKAENIFAVEAPPFIEDLPLVETPAVEESALVETPPIARVAPLAEPQIFAEPIEAETMIENPPFEDSTAFEIAPVIEAPAIYEAQTFAAESLSTEAASVVENPPFEDLPVVELVETSAMVENSPLVEIVEDSPSVEFQAIDETPVAVELQTPVEELSLIEAETANDDLSLVEAEAFIESPAATAENQTAAENPSAGDAPIVAEETELPVKAFDDYSTNKLPPIEKIIANRLPENFKITEIEPIFSLKSKLRDIHTTSEPVLIDWEQPDDVPLVTQNLDAEIKETADTQFAFADAEDSVIDAGDADAPPVSEQGEIRPTYAAELPFSAYDDSGTSWNLPDKRKILTGAGILALLVLAVGGTLLSRQLQSSGETQQTTAQTAPSEKSLTKSAEPDKVSETDKPLTAKPEKLAVSNPSADTDSLDVPDLPNYQPRESAEKTVAPISQVRNNKRPVKENPETREQVTQTKNTTTAVFDKKGEVKSPRDKKPADKSKLSTSTKTDIFTRPRVVKNPKF